MTVHVLVPVHNRAEQTARVLEHLRSQQADECIRVVTIDDGSTDGTSAILNGHRDVTVIRGDGNLWWAGAIELGLKRVLGEAASSDWVLFMNNDTRFGQDFVQKLLDAARLHAPAAVGSVICDESMPGRLISIGPELDTHRLCVRDKLDRKRQWNAAQTIQAVDVLSGRGTLYPLAAFRKAGTMRPRRLPHYLADYELSLRVRQAGYRLLVSEQAVTFSVNKFGSEVRLNGLWARFFSIRSVDYLPAKAAFWWQASTPLERVSLLPKLVYKNLILAIKAQ